ncbi:MAG: hypothetical protein DMG39_00880 [Acidobacteria bacterium]|nr:MAG: hypothetical protein DMG39_00880 [Acidobacteriota bacterium]
MEATSQLFSLLGVRPELGSDFTSQDDTNGSARVVLLSHGLWHRLFGNDPAVVSRELRLDAKSYEIIGVLPKEIEALYPHVEIWIPAVFNQESRYRQNIAGMSDTPCWGTLSSWRESQTSAGWNGNLCSPFQRRYLCAISR